MATFKSTEEYQQWISSQDWYQTIELPSGLLTPGKVATNLRAPLLDTIDFKGKSFLDVGCNSGQYCLMAKARGAEEVMGVDINAKRIGQARVLAENEGLDIRFEERSIFDLGSMPRFDIVWCIAVVTEIQDFIGAIERLKGVIGKRAYIELDLAKPLVYLSRSKYWLRGYPNLSRRTAVAEVRQSNDGAWVWSPSFEVLGALFGSDFTLKRLGPGVRYDLVEVVRVAG